MNDSYKNSEQKYNLLNLSIFNKKKILKIIIYYF
jgi:hypothetical protein